MNAQSNSAWSSQLLGYNTDPNYNIGNFGCLVDAWGNMLIATTGDQQWTPARVNDWMKEHQGFVAGGGIFIFSVALGMGGVTAHGITGDVSQLNSFLKDPPNFAIIEVKGPRGQHFVLGSAVNTIIDSQDGRQKALKTYPFVQAHLYTAIAMPAPAAQTPTGPVMSGLLDTVVTINVGVLNAREQPNLGSPVMATAHLGTIHVNEWKVGDTVTINGRTDNIWLRTDGNHWIGQAGTTRG